MQQNPQTPKRKGSSWRPKLGSCLTFLVIVGCGAQVADPTAGVGGQVNLIASGIPLESIVNVAFLNTLDGISMGDYAYSKTESRIVTLRDCQTRGPSGAFLNKKASISREIQNEAGSVYASSTLIVERSYQDSWSQNDRILDCDPTLDSIQLDLQRLRQAPVLLQSTVREEWQRKLYLLDKNSSTESYSKLIVHKEGARSLLLYDLQNTDRDLEISAKLFGDRVIEDVQLEKNVRSSEVARLRSSSLPLNFQIQLDKRTLQWKSYTLPTAQLDYEIVGGEQLHFDLTNLRLDRETGCIPQSGTLQLTIKGPNSTSRTYRTQFGKNSNKELYLKASESSSADTIRLAPFACVLGEK